MSTPRSAWSGAGVLAGLAGLATSLAAANFLHLRSSPVGAVAETVIEYVPGTLAAKAIEMLGHRDKFVLVVVICVVLLALSGIAGRVARASRWAPIAIFVVMGAVALAASMTRQDATSVDVIPIVIGVLTWIMVLTLLTDALPPDDEVGPESVAGERSGVGTLFGTGWQTRRGFVHKSAVVAALAAGIAFFGSVLGGRRRDVEEARRLLRLPVTLPTKPAKVSILQAGMPDWQTPTEDFYLIHTALVVPTIKPQDWSLRIHGMVDRELILTYADLIEGSIAERWVTLNCVSNPIGGPLIGNAWWSGVLLADLLSQAGVKSGADAIKQTSHDGWTCGTPLDAVIDPDRHAMLAIAMNGDPLPIEHGFPVRTLVPGLYGYVSACKWVIDIEVTRFDKFEAYWTGKGWSERGPVKIASRVDVPHNGKSVTAGTVVIGGHAWSQHIGIRGVQIAVDGGSWKDVALAEVPSKDTWVQWKAEVELGKGDHTVRVRAIGVDGTVQTGAKADVVPDGATGWHEIGFNAT